MKFGPVSDIIEVIEPYHVTGKAGLALCGADPGKRAMIDPSRRPRPNMSPVCAVCAKLRGYVPQASVAPSGASTWDELLDRF